MPAAIETELAGAVAEILEPNLQFLRAGQGDKALYLVGPEMLQAMAWTVTVIVLPLLMTGANEVIKAKVKDWLDARRVKGAPPTPPDNLREEVVSLLDAGSKPGTDPEETAQAVAAVADYLSDRGWPMPMALADAKEIVELLRRRLGNRK